MQADPQVVGAAVQRRCSSIKRLAQRRQVGQRLLGQQELVRCGPPVGAHSHRFARPRSTWPRPRTKRCQRRKVRLRWAGRRRRASSPPSAARAEAVCPTVPPGHGMGLRQRPVRRRKEVRVARHLDAEGRQPAKEVICGLQTRHRPVFRHRTPSEPARCLPRHDSNIVRRITDKPPLGVPPDLEPIVYSVWLVRRQPRRGGREVAHGVSRGWKACAARPQPRRGPTAGGGVRQAAEPHGSAMGYLPAAPYRAAKACCPKSGGTPTAAVGRVAHLFGLCRLVGCRSFGKLGKQPRLES